METEKTIKAVNTLIERGEAFDFKNYSDDENRTIYGGNPSTEWIVWTKRIGDLLTKNLKSNSESFIAYNEAVKIRTQGNLQDSFKRAKTLFLKALIAFKKILIEGDDFNELLFEFHEITNTPIPVAVSKKVQDVSVINPNEVFIVHGHDAEAESKAARFIEKLGLKPIILHEQASSSSTIIEKIEQYSNVSFGIVLYTPCDIGSKKTDKPDLKPRARQNVVFEHGYLIGKIGRRNVCALVKGDVETPNDISGVVYVKMDDDNAWHMKIARELKAAGYKIDAEKMLS